MICDRCNVRRALSARRPLYLSLMSPRTSPSFRFAALIARLGSRLLATTDSVLRMPAWHNGLALITLLITAAFDVMGNTVQIMYPVRDTVWSKIAEDVWTIVETIIITGVLTTLELAPQLAKHQRRLKAALLPAISGMSLTFLIINVSGEDGWADTTATSSIINLSKTLATAFRAGAFLLAADHAMKTIADLLSNPTRHAPTEQLDGPLLPRSGQWREVQQPEGESEISLPAMSAASLPLLSPGTSGVGHRITGARSISGSRGMGSVASLRKPLLSGSSSARMGEAGMLLSPGGSSSLQGRSDAGGIGMDHGAYVDIIIESTGSGSGSRSVLGLGGGMAAAAALPLGHEEDGEEAGDGDEDIAAAIAPGGAGGGGTGGAALATKVEDDRRVLARRVVDAVHASVALRGALYGRRPIAALSGALFGGGCGIIIVAAISITPFNIPLIHGAMVILCLLSLVNLAGFYLFVHSAALWDGWMRPIAVPFEVWGREMPKSSGLLRAFLPSIGATGWVSPHAMQIAGARWAWSSRASRC